MEKLHGTIKRLTDRAMPGLQSCRACADRAFPGSGRIDQLQSLIEILAIAMNLA